VIKVGTDLNRKKKRTSYYSPKKKGRGRFKDDRGSKASLGGKGREKIVK